MRGSGTSIWFPDGGGSLQKFGCRRRVLYEFKFEFLRPAELALRGLGHSGRRVCGIPFAHGLATCLKRTSAGRASEVSGDSDGREKSRRRCHNAGRSPTRLARAAQRRQTRCKAARRRLEHHSPTTASAGKKMLQDVKVTFQTRKRLTPRHLYHQYSHTRHCAPARRCVGCLIFRFSFHPVHDV